MAYLGLACRAVLVLVFLVSALSKIRRRAAFDEFAATVAAMRLVPRRWIRPVAVLVVVAEAASVVLLASPAPAVVSFGVALGLLAALTGAVVVTLRRGVPATCRCFGASSSPLGRVHVGRNLMLLACAAAGLAMSAAGSARHPAAVAISLVAAGVAALFVIRIDDVASLYATDPGTRPTPTGR